MSDWIDRSQKSGNFIFAIASGSGKADILTAQGRLREALRTYQESLQLASAYEKEAQRGIPVSPYLTVARKNLANSERIAFFGFGYDETNLAKLDWPHKRPTAAHVEGKWKGIPSNRAKDLSQWFKIAMPDYGNATVEEFLKSSHPLERVRSVTQIGAAIAD